ncbi:MAG TPA: hypothetical protein VFQ68_21875 [Streptosporangiaceae bacterium]|nr:hypothetical protein [Streptosporangiaceae bacterium]
MAGYTSAAECWPGVCLPVRQKGIPLLIIFGFRVFYRTLAQGTFHCRRCGGDREYRHRAGRRWFTLFFLPVIPLNAVGEHVQCTSCRTRYVTDVLGQPTTAQMQAALPVGMRAAVSAMLRSGDPSNQASRQRAVEAVVRSGVPDYNEAMLDADLTQSFDVIRPALNQVGAQLATQAREWYLAEVIRIAMADGPLSETERHAALAIGTDLGMTQAQVIGVVAMTEQSAGRD